MKKSSTLIFALFLNIFLYGQTTFNASISLDYMNVIYTTVDNPITINVNVPLSDIECSINKNGAIEKERFNSYRVRVTEEGYYQFKITQKSTGASVSYSLRAKRLPIPIANLNKVFGDTISISQLSQAKQLDLSYVPAFDINIFAEVSSFTILKISKSNGRSESNNFTSVFSQETGKLVSSCSKGDILIFKNIKAKGVDPGELKIPDLILYVE
jgi:GldM C-terminal domain